MKAILFTVAVLLAGIPATVSQAGTIGPARPHTVQSGVTGYTWWSNSPPGNGIEFPGRHHHAGGIGTYRNPVTFATSRFAIRPGTRIYIPYLHKYFIMEDGCAECEQLWNDGHKLRVDLWFNGKRHTPDSAQNIADAMTDRIVPIIINPPRGLPVRRIPLICYRPGNRFTC